MTHVRPEQVPDKPRSAAESRSAPGRPAGRAAYAPTPAGDPDTAGRGHRWPAAEGRAQLTGPYSTGRSWRRRRCACRAGSAPCRTPFAFCREPHWAGVRPSLASVSRNAQSSMASTSWLMPGCSAISWPRDSVTAWSSALKRSCPRTGWTVSGTSAQCAAIFAPACSARSSAPKAGFARQALVRLAPPPVSQRCCAMSTRVSRSL